MKTSTGGRTKGIFIPEFRRDNKEATLSFLDRTRRDYKREPKLANKSPF